MKNSNMVDVISKSMIWGGLLLMTIIVWAFAVIGATRVWKWIF